jgi:DNA-binding transcriptional LysR family regulator
MLSQPAVTYRLKKMEDEMGVQLFIKSNRGVTLTSAGERLLSYADRMLQQYGSIVEYVKKMDGVISGTIHLGSTPTFANTRLPSLFREFHSLYPKISILLIWA